MKRTLLTLALIGFTGCTDSNMAWTQNLADGNFDASFWIARPAAGTLTIDLARPSDGSSNTTGNCLRLQDTTLVTANGVYGTLVDPGTLKFGADSCDPVEFQVPVDPALGVIEVVLDDGTAQVHFRLVEDSTFHYQVTRCGAASCEVDN